MVENQNRYYLFTYLFILGLCSSTGDHTLYGRFGDTSRKMGKYMGKCHDNTQI